MMMVLDIFHHGTAIRISGMTACRGDGGEWEWVSVDVAMEVTGIWTIKEYMSRLQATIVECVAGIPI